MRNELFMKAVKENNVELVERLFPTVTLNDAEKVYVVKKNFIMKSNLLLDLFNDLPIHPNGIMMYSILVKAIRERYDEAIERILKLNIDVNEKPYGMSSCPFYIAFEEADTPLKIINMFLNAGARVDLNRCGKFAIWSAAMYGRLDIFILLLEKVQNDKLLDFVLKNACEIAAKNNRFNIIEYCYNNGIKITNKVYYNAILFNNFSLVNTLINLNSNFALSGKDIYCPLTAAAFIGNFNLVKQLELFFLPKSQKEREIVYTKALKAAFVGNHVEITKFLLDKGANPNHVLEKDHNFMLSLNEKKFKFDENIFFTHKKAKRYFNDISEEEILYLIKNKKKIKPIHKVIRLL